MPTATTPDSDKPAELKPPIARLNERTSLLGTYNMPCPAR